jgi:hypothetical protein
MKKSLLAYALNVAKEKLPLHPQLEYFPHYTFIVQNNHIVDWATNLSQNPPVHYGYKNNSLDPDYRPKVHSEIAAYKKAKGIMDKNQGFEIINIRLNKHKEIRLSKPCFCCFEILCELGCQKFYYSSELGFLKLT